MYYHTKHGLQELLFNTQVRRCVNTLVKSGTKQLGIRHNYHLQSPTDIPFSAGFPTMQPSFFPCACTNISISVALSLHQYPT